MNKLNKKNFIGIYGVGGVGLMSVIALNALGFKSVYAVDHNARNLLTSKKYGCKKIFNFSKKKDRIKFQSINKKQAIIKASLIQGLSKNGPRKHYMRAEATLKNNKWFVKPYSDQNSHNLAVLNKANSLIIRKEFDDAVKTGELVKIIKLEI